MGIHRSVNVPSSQWISQALPRYYIIFKMQPGEEKQPRVVGCPSPSVFYHQFNARSSPGVVERAEQGPRGTDRPGWPGHGRRAVGHRRWVAGWVHSLPCFLAPSVQTTCFAMSPTSPEVKRGRFLPTSQGNCEANGSDGGESLQAGSCKDFCSQTGGCSPQPLITQPSFNVHRHLQSITQRTRHCQGIHCGSFLEMCSNYFSLIITPTVLIIMSGFGLSLRAGVYGLCFILDGRGFILSGYMFSFQLTVFVYPVYILIQRGLLIPASQRRLGMCCTGSSSVHIPTLSF